MSKSEYPTVKEKRMKRLLASMRGIRYLVMEAELDESPFPTPKSEKATEKKEDDKQ
ncbi:MAG: hypothetical protein ACXAEL_14905 [Candidatus Hodarchaeales archaeon]|jgi:hypothetical protein